MPLLIIPGGHAAPVAAGFPVVSAEAQFTQSAWTDITRWTRLGGGGNVAIIRGASRVESPVIRYEAGTAAFGLDNRDRRFDAANLAGPYVAGGSTQVLPMVPLRWSATFASVTYRLFTGTVNSWTVTYTPPSDSVTAVACTDGFKILAANKRTPKTVYQGPGEDSGRRVTRILDDAGWPSAQRNITPGDATLQATLLSFTAPGVIATFVPAGGSGTNTPDYTAVAGAQSGAAVATNVQAAVPISTPLDELQLTAETEMGELYIDGNGFVTFRHRNGIWLDARSVTPQAVFGDSPGTLHGGLPELSYQSVTMPGDDATLYNGATVANAGGVLQVATDPAPPSWPPQTPHVYDNQNLIADTDFQSLGYAQWVVATSRNPELRFSDITINPLRNPASLFPQVLGRQIGDRITIVRRPPGGGSAITRDAIIRGITHTFTSKTWETVFTLQDISNYPQPMIWDDAVNGVWDTSMWGF